MASAAPIVPRVEEERYLALLRAANTVATCNDCNTISDTLINQLREVTAFDYLHLVVFPKQKVPSPCWCLLEADGKKSETSGTDSLYSEDTPIALVHASGEHLVTLDWNRETRFQKYGFYLSELRIRSTCTLALTRGQRHVGVLSLGRLYPNAYDEDEVRFLGLVADHIGLALDAAVNFYVSQRVQDQLKLILDLTNQVVSNLDFNDLLHAASASVREVMH